MAIIANLAQPYPDFTSVGSGVVFPIIANRFPVPQMALGVCADLDLVLDPLAIISPYYVMNALHPEGTHLEPTTGQIWPRIG